ncbi:CBU_0592 family membrane protein [Roseivirga pacifica]|uniref:CBU_0592 family membrane protein n=1 Tax=Roseivirga pacifica TaxID=1267423 RepID=UPI003BAD94F3
MKLWVDISGWLGSFMVVLSYALTLSKGRDFSALCSYLNLTGAILIAINCLFYMVLPSFVTNVIWSIIALVSIYRANKHFFKRKKKANRYKKVTKKLI